MVFKVLELIEYISLVMMFEFGDIIVIGMFVGVGLFRYGDYIEVWIEGIGKVEFDVLVEDLILC